MKRYLVILFALLLLLTAGCITQTSFKKEAVKPEPSPIEFQKAWVTKNILNGSEARITFKNISSKTIDGVKILMYCYTNFDDPNSGTDGEGMTLQTQEVVKPQEIFNGENYSWNLFPNDDTTKFKAILTDRKSTRLNSSH